MTAADELPLIGSEPPSLGRLSPLMWTLQATAPVCRVRTPAGDEAWLVTRHAEIKQLLLDDRLVRSHADPPNAPRYVDNPLLDMLIATGDPAGWRADRARTRTLFTPIFSARRMLELQPRIAAHVEAALEPVLAHGPPADLHTALSAPVTIRVLYDLLGVPAADHDQFKELYGLAADLSDPETAAGGAAAFLEFLRGLAARKRTRPADDVISHLCRAGLPDADVATLTMTLAGGHGTTSGNINMGILLFATNPDQRDLVVRDPSLLPDAVEEVVRLAKTGESFVPRYASADIEIGGVTIRTGDLVLTDHTFASFDERVFDRPERFDVTRSPNVHLGFSGGLWHCLGASLARTELQTFFGTVLPRLPDLRLAVPVEQLTGGRRLAGGRETIPVTWN
jgi:cytochrome P450 monooxygenase